MFLPAVLFASALVLQQTPPAAQTTPPAPATSQAPDAAGPVTNLPPVNVAAAPAQPTQVCRTESVTGSRFGRRVCRNSVQTAEEAAAGREMLRRLQGARMPDG